jgi:crossover junction endodeoxyribonuclease RusA
VVDLHIILPLPPLVNRYWRHARGVTYLSKEGRDYKRTVAQLLDANPTEQDVVVSATVYRKRKVGDIDGYAKGLLDAMAGLVYDDDKRVTELHLYKRDDKLNPRVEVRVWSADAALGLGAQLVIE